MHEDRNYDINNYDLHNTKCKIQMSFKVFLGHFRGTFEKNAFEGQFTGVFKQFPTQKIQIQPKDQSP